MNGGVVDVPPPLPDGWEWVTPNGRPYDRVPVMVVPEDAPAAVREGVARRRILAVEGECPCGGMTHWHQGPEDPEDAERLTHVGEVRPAGRESHHWDDCPAADVHLLPALDAWRQDRVDGR